MRAIAGVQYGITALLIGYAAFSMMMQSVNGGPSSWWGPVMLGAAILLMVAGVRAFAPRLAIIWLAVMAAATPLGICTAFGAWPLRCWIFAIALGLAAWAIFKVDVAIRRGDVAAFTVGLLLAISWISISVSTIQSYLSPNAARASVIALIVLLFYWVLIISVLLRAGFTVFSRRQSDGSLRHRNRNIHGAQ
jgi:hypothetical protein